MLAPSAPANAEPLVSDKFIATSEAINNLEPLFILSVSWFVVPPNVFAAHVVISPAVNELRPAPWYKKAVPLVAGVFDPPDIVAVVLLNSIRPPVPAINAKDSAPVTIEALVKFTVPLENTLNAPPVVVTVPPVKFKLLPTPE